MPNWVSNSLSVSGDSATLKAMAEKLNTPVTKHHPELSNVDGEWKEVEATQLFSNPIFSFFNVIAPTDLETYYATPKLEPRIEKEFNPWPSILNDIATKNDWYNWNVRNWGTKWDIAAFDGEQYGSTTVEEISPEQLLYHFQTAWSPVFPVIEKLSEQYPTLVFDYEYEEEQGWGGEAAWKDGEITFQSQYDEPNSHTDFVERDNEDGCVCSWLEDSESWYDDCPREVEA